MPTKNPVEPKEFCTITSEGSIEIIKHQYLKMKKTIVGIVFIFLVILMVIPKTKSDSEVVSGFADGFVCELDGWKVEDRPLAESPELLNRINRILNYDDALYRMYSRDDLVIALYAAYWKPVNRSYEFLLKHVPDRCWVFAGWTLLEAEDGYGLEARNWSLVPGQFRSMGKQDTVVEMVYWILYEGKIVEYHDGLLGDANLSITEKVRWFFRGINERQEEGNYFIRISSNRSIDELRDDAGFKAIIDALKLFGLERSNEK